MIKVTFAWALLCLLGTGATFGQYATEPAFPNLTFTSPVDIQNAGDGSNRLFVVEQAGVIQVFQNDPAVTASSVFLDINSRVSSGGERGLLGLAFHPDFPDSAYFYVNYTAPAPLRTRVSRFSLDTTDTSVGDPNSELILLTVDQPYSNHNGGQLRFGLDGMLYVATGDGGSSGDPDGNGQNLSTLLGALLRIDVDNPDAGLNYGVPSDNPFVGVAGAREEIFAYGLRNPWRFSFDTATGQLWAADVGQNEYEEIDTVSAGGNYGWNVMEASSCYEAASCDQTGLELPVWEYVHENGNQSVTGGFVYRGSRTTELIGKYVYGDYISGRIWALDATSDTVLTNSELVDAPFNIPTFGVDESGDLLIASFDGTIYRLVTTEPTLVSASDSTFEDRVQVTWGSGAPSGDSFKVLRDSVLLSTEADTVTVFDDFTGDPGVVYDYCVVQVTSSGDSAPVCDLGSKSIFAPDSLVATDGTFDTHVQLTWADASSVESGYVVLRDSLALDSLAVNAMSYQDSSAVAGVQYNYCVHAFDALGFKSALSCDTGMRAVVPPDSVTATDGTFLSFVRVTWVDPVLDEVGFRIRRDGEVIATVGPDTTTYDDSQAFEGIVHTYCVSTVSNSTVESSQSCDTGSRSSGELLTWAIRLSAEIGSSNDLENRIGVADSATTGFDSAFEDLEPPAGPGESIRLFFSRPEWLHPLGDEFSSDVRPPINLSDTAEVWDFDVVSTSSGLATLTFDFATIPEVPVLLTSNDDGTRWALTNGQSIDVSVQKDSTHRFSVAVGDTTGPALVLGASMSGPRVLRAGSTHQLDWTVSDGFQTDSLWLYFSPDSARTWYLVTDTLQSNTHSWTVPDSTLLLYTALRLDAKDFSGNMTSASSSAFCAIASDTLAVPIRSGWSLWGPILDSATDTMAIALSPSFSGYWTTYEYDQGGYHFANELSSTRGYWLASEDSVSLSLVGAPLTGDTTVVLDPGWVMLSNPFVIPVRVDSLRFSDGGGFVSYADAVSSGWVTSPYQYTGTSYVAATELRASDGFWIDVLVPNVTVEFPIHAPPAPISGKRAPGRVAEEQWLIALEAEAGGFRDVTAQVGVALAATDGFDPAFDWLEPPVGPGSEYVRLFVDRSDLEGLGSGGLARDVRALDTADAVEWRLQLQSSFELVALRWTVPDIPQEVALTLRVGTSAIDMRSTSEVTTEGTQTITVVASAAGGVGLEDGVLPVSYALEQNYPNPFNPSTLIRYDLPQAGHVRLEVYDVLGRRVDVLVDEIKSAGHHSITWDASYQASGLYIYRLESGDFVSARSMTVVK